MATSPALCSLLLCAVGLGLCSAAAPNTSNITDGAKGLQYNVLHLICDDLRPEIAGGYKQPHVITPNFDRLAATGLVFERASCNVAVCCPSRNSFMTGRRPDHTHVISNGDTCHKSFRDVGPNWTTLPGHFKAAGYTVLGGGKTFHPNSPKDFDNPRSWTQSKHYPYFHFTYGSCSPNKPKEPCDDASGIDTWCPQEKDDEEFYDWTLANHTIAVLEHAQKMGKPFYVAAGFAKPHVPWQVPKRIWDMYEDVDIPLPTHMEVPSNMPDIAYHDQGVWTPDTGVCYKPRTLNKTCVGNQCPMNDSITKLVRRAYYSAVTWVDSQIGRVLDALKDLGLEDNTIVLVHGDHGYHLMEHQMIHKQTAFELTSRVPLIVRAPFKPASVGKTTDAFIELVDLFPTLSELSGVGLPTNETLDGKSHAALFDNPAASGPATSLHWQYARCIKNGAPNEWDHNECGAYKDKKTYMGYTMRNNQWRYTAWVPYNVTTFKGDWDAAPHAQELYNHTGAELFDFNESELDNVANDPTFQSVVQQLHQQLRDFFSTQ
eukprot:m.117620 g.117620  ORF g.117620 m.117620 type:complete len:544 (+) comp16405_c0_seq1:48-1679(+)